MIVGEHRGQSEIVIDPISPKLWSLSQMKQASPGNLNTNDKGCFGSYMKLCDFILLFMTLQVELRLNKGSLVRPRLVDQVNTCIHH